MEKAAAAFIAGAGFLMAVPPISPQILAGSAAALAVGIGAALVGRRQATAPGSTVGSAAGREGRR
jgi:hypothetical protein